MYEKEDGSYRTWLNKNQEESGVFKVEWQKGWKTNFENKNQI